MTNKPIKEPLLLTAPLLAAGIVWCVVGAGIPVACALILGCAGHEIAYYLGRLI